MRSPHTIPALNAIWPSLAKAAGLHPDHYTLTAEWVQHDDGRESHVGLYSSPDRPGVVLKQITRKITLEDFQKTVTAQSRMSKAMGTGRNRVPAVLATDPGNRSFLMEAASGPTAFVLCEATEDHLPVLRRCGAWLAAFHSAGLEERRPFRPHFNQTQIASLIDHVRDGQKTVADAALFIEQAQAVLDELPAQAGRQTISAAGHGDLNLRNLMLGDNVVWGIDITRNEPVPVGYDVARFLLHYTTLLADLSTLKPGDIVPQPALDAFFQGYTLTDPTDPSIQTLLKVRLLNDWARMPDSPWRRSLRENFRLGRIQTVLANALRV